MLGRGSDPASVQPHLLSLFSNIKRAEFDDAENIVAVISAEGERLAFLTERHVSTSSKLATPEMWLDWLEKEMRVTVCSQALDAAVDCGALSDDDSGDENHESQNKNMKVQAKSTAVQDLLREHTLQSCTLSHCKQNGHDFAFIALPPGHAKVREGLLASVLPCGGRHRPSRSSWQRCTSTSLENS